MSAPPLFCSPSGFQLCLPVSMLGCEHWQMRQRDMPAPAAPSMKVENLWQQETEWKQHLNPCPARMEREGTGQSHDKQFLIRDQCQARTAQKTKRRNFRSWV